MSMFSHAMFLETFQTLQKNVHQTSIDHGFWDGSTNPDNVSIPCKLMLTVSELSEALEDHRSELPEGFTISQIQYWSDDGSVYTQQQRRHEDDMRPEFKPCGFAIEMADAVIRIMDICERLDIDLADAIMVKADYNRYRPFKHGKSY